jgi:hypothetical protein
MSQGQRWVLPRICGQPPPSHQFRLLADEVVQRQAGPFLTNRQPINRAKFKNSAPSGRHELA